MNEPSFQDERGLHLVAEMQSAPEDKSSPMRGIFTGVAAGAVCWAGLWLLVALWRCCR